MAREIKQRQVKFDNAQVDDQGVFEGYASVYGVVDSDREILEPGVFGASLSGGSAAGGVKLLAQHNEWELPVGKSLELRETGEGLYIKGLISATGRGRDIRQLIRDGVLDSMSVGYEVSKSEMDSQGIRHIQEADLLEVSIVTWPANPEATIQSYKGDKRMRTKAQSGEIMDGLIDQLLGLADKIRNLKDVPPDDPVNSEAGEDEDYIELDD